MEDEKNQLLRKQKELVEEEIETIESGLYFFIL